MTQRNEVAVDQLAVWIAAYREATSNAKQWQDTAERAKEHITATLAAADAEVGTVDGKPAVRYTIVESTRLDTKKLRAEHPELVDQFSVPSSSRRFTIVDKDR